MADVFHRFPIRASQQRVFTAMTSPEGLDQWWTKSSSGTPVLGAVYELGFGEGYQWRAIVTRCEPGRGLEWTITQAMEDWLATRVGFSLEEENGGVTTVDFYHAGWREASEHFRVSSCCWAMYLRILRRHVELGEVVPYEARLDA